MLLLVCVYGEGGGSSHHRPGLLSGVREVLLLSATLHHVSGQKQACQLVLVQMLPPLRRQLGCQTRCRRAPPPVQLLACLKRAAAGQLQPASVFPTPSCRQQKKKERREKERERERKKRERREKENNERKRQQRKCVFGTCGLSSLGNSCTYGQFVGKNANFRH